MLIIQAWLCGRTSGKTAIDTWKDIAKDELFHKLKAL